jgi:hypothetical protein
MSISAEGLEDLQAVVQQWCERHAASAELAEVETLAVSVSRVAGQAVMAHGLPGAADKAGYQGSSVVCGCGRKAKFVQYRRRFVGTLYGPVEAWRAYYHCGHCKSGQAPWDREQGLSRLLWTPGVKALVAEAAGRLPYGEAVNLLERFTGLAVEESCAERIVAEVAGRLREREQALMSGYDGGELRPLVSVAPKRLYVSMDGTSAHLDGSWHEVKTGVIYEARRGAEGLDECCRARYVAASEPAAVFGERLYLTAAQAGAEQAAQVVVLGDGAEWIWNLARHHYPEATHIVDYWHACEHIHQLAQAVYGENSVNGKRWAREHCRRLKERGPATLLGALKRMKPRTAQAADALARERGYFSNHRHRMQYHKYRAAKMMIGSGPAEAACKTVVGARLKQSGMRWSLAGADHVLAIRTRLLSAQHEEIAQAAQAA